MAVPLYKRIEKDITDQIIRGELREGDWVASESELMSRYFVSSITARNALNGLVDQGLIVRVRGKGSFVAASSLALGASAHPRVTISAIFPTMTARVELSYLQSLEEFCADRNIDLSIHCSRESPETQARLIQTSISDGAKGIILFPTVVETMIPQVRSLVERQFPIVLIDRYATDLSVSWVTSDNQQGAQLATNHLLELVGPSVAMLHFPLYNSTVIDRYDGFRQAFAERGLDFGPSNACLIDDSGLLDTSHRERVERIYPVIADHLTRHNQIKGIFAANAEIAQIGFYTARHLGLKPGEDFHLVSFDNPHLPGVPYIRQDFGRIIAEAVVILQRHIAGDGSPDQVVIPVQFTPVSPGPGQDDWLSHVVMGVGR